MKELRVRNVCQAYPQAIQLLLSNGAAQESRNGPTLEIPEPVAVVYENPKERVLFNPVRDCNPFLSFFEALWIIAGRDDVHFLKTIVDNMKNYSDDGYRFYGSYGRRLRRVHPGLETGAKTEWDQVSKAIDRLKKNPNDRRVVLVIRNPTDMWYDGKDTPCNLMVDCKVRGGKLNISVFNRSNDTVWGMLGTNVVQFSVLQEYMAGMIGCEVGEYHQITTSMHAYLNPQWEKCRDNAGEFDHYSEGDVEPYDMMQGDKLQWEYDLRDFFRWFDTDYEESFTPKTPFFKDVVVPMWKTFLAWNAYKVDRTPIKFFACANAKQSIGATDWRRAVAEWLNRREQGATMRGSDV